MAGGKFSEANLFGMTIRESANDGSDFTNPDADYRRLFLGEDGLLHLKDSAGTVTDITASGSVATDAIWDAKGDLAVGTGANTAAKLTVGANDTIPMADSGQATGIKWVASQTPSTQAFSDAAAEGTADTYARGDHKHAMPANPGGGSFTYPIDSVALNGTYGDEFDGASLNGRWTRHVQGSGEEAYQQGSGASALRVTYSTGAAARYIYQTAPNGTNETWECSLGMWSDTTGQMFALLMVDTSGNGVAALLYDNARGLILANIASHGYSSALSAPTYGDAFARAGQRHWLRLRKASGVYYASYSFNGETYSPEASGTPSAFTPARVGVGRILGTSSTSNIVDWFRFNKTA